MADGAGDTFPYVESTVAVAAVGTNPPRRISERIAGGYTVLSPDAPLENVADSYAAVVYAAALT